MRFEWKKCSFCGRTTASYGQQMASPVAHALLSVGQDIACTTVRGRYKLLNYQCMEFAYKPLSKLLKGGYVGDYIGYYYRGY